MGIDVVHPNKTQMAQIVALQDDTIDMTSVPVVTMQTVTSTKAKIPASAKSGRRVMMITNLDETRTIRVGGTAITAKLGLLVEPSHTVKIVFDLATPQDVYAVATGAEVKVEVIEQ